MGVLQGVKIFAAYGAAKAYELILGEGLWDELRDHGVDACAYVVGATATPNFVHNANKMTPPDPEALAARSGSQEMRPSPSPAHPKTSPRHCSSSSVPGPGCTHIRTTPRAPPTLRHFRGRSRRTHGPAHGAVLEIDDGRARGSACGRDPALEDEPPAVL